MSFVSLISERPTLTWWRFVGFSLLALSTSQAAALQIFSLIGPGSDSQVVIGQDATPEGDVDRLVIRLDPRGYAILQLPHAGGGMPGLRELTVDIDRANFAVRMAAFWSIPGTDEFESQPLSQTSATSFSLSLGERRSFPSGLLSFALRITGPPGQQIEVRDIRLSVDGHSGPLLSDLRELVAYRDWSVPAINSFNNGGVAILGVPPVVGVVVLMLAIALPLILLSRMGKLRLTVSIPYLFLGAWILLDFLWLRELTARAGMTYERFAQVSPAKRLDRSIDARVVDISRQVAPRLQEGARVFVATNDDWVGNRLAFYLYPKNVYWLRGGPELPSPSELRAGDTILVVHPSDATVNLTEGALYTSEGRKVEVRSRGDRPWGYLLEVAI